ncbi:MAG: hypothetical protein ACR2FS_03110 [Phormidesmis sp.]
MSRQATKQATVQIAGNRVRFTVMIDTATHEILVRAHETLNYRQVAQLAITQFAAELKAKEQAQISA